MGWVIGGSHPTYSAIIFVASCLPNKHRSH
jgi:hypothetical protein